MTSATVLGTLIIGSGRHRFLRDHHRFAVKLGLLRQTPSLARPEPFYEHCRSRARLVGLRRSLVRENARIFSATKPKWSPASLVPSIVPPIRMAAMRALRSS